MLAILVAAAATAGIIARQSMSPSAGAVRAAHGIPALKGDSATESGVASADGSAPGGAWTAEDQLAGDAAWADGDLPEGVTVFDSVYPGVANLDPDLLEALWSAGEAAGVDGIVLEVNSGWRSPEHQARLLREAVAEHGSAAEAARWVATPERSLHVSGDAVDIGPAESTEWLVAHGAAHGLCQVYRNEPWHFELRLEAAARGCPALYADPTHDPRLSP
jgi:LAS superfamily LD-carboxypeptidase LdcB